MGEKVWFALPSRLVAADGRLLEAFDRVIGDGERRAAAHLACRIGCTACCIGPFDITALDAARLRRGLEDMRLRDPEGARAVAARASAQWKVLGDSFPGARANGILDPDDGRREAFFARFADVPCPVLDPATGACLLYGARPLSCRSFGLPVRSGFEVLPPCTLNFTLATPREVADATVEPDRGDLEGALLAEAARYGVPAADTIVCAALSDESYA